MESKYSLPKDGGLIFEGTPRDIIHRYEKIPTSVFDVESEGVSYVADLVEQAIANHNASGQQRPFALGLSTGRTPIGLYRELAARYKAGKLSFANVEVYSIDEFYPAAKNGPQSRSYRIYEDLLSLVDIKPENIHTMDSDIPVEKLSAYCADYDYKSRGIDLLLIGMGEQGQVGFNEPGSYAKSVTRMVQLTYQSRKTCASQFYGVENTPKMAITMGLNTVMSAKRIVLMAWGEGKASVIGKIVEGDATRMIPASLLQNHPNIEAVVDDPAAHCKEDSLAGWPLRVDITSYA